jgi:hypothetical protein
MSTNNQATGLTRRPLTFCYIGRPVSLYIDAMAKRRRTHTDPASSASGTAEQATAP